MAFKPSFDEPIPEDMQAAVDTQMALYRLSVSAFPSTPKTPASHKQKTSDSGDPNDHSRTPTRRRLLTSGHEGSPAPAPWPTPSLKRITNTPVLQSSNDLIPISDLQASSVIDLTEDSVDSPSLLVSDTDDLSLDQMSDLLGKPFNLSSTSPEPNSKHAKWPYKYFAPMHVGFKKMESTTNRASFKDTFDCDSGKATINCHLKYYLWAPSEISETFMQNVGSTWRDFQDAVAQHFGGHKQVPGVSQFRAQSKGKVKEEGKSEFTLVVE
ncbi:hypothetical protein PQX77_021350 [Marasmius sp. AFHP31]|nr:hypothetical protein PQX77_021350 [Marasmius sp. AFHP31]